MADTSAPAAASASSMAVSNAKDDTDPTNEKLLVVGPAGAGKTTQLLTLPGRKFMYFFDPNARRAVQGHDLDYVEMLPEPSEVDWTLKAFNKDSRPSDKPKGTKEKEPLVYQRWQDDINNRYDAGFFNNYNWIGVDSISLLVKAVMNRILFLNKRYGDVEDLSDYRVAGNKLAEIFVPITSLKNINLFCTGHLIERQNELTKKITVELDIPGASRSLLPKMFSHILELRSSRDDSQQYNMLTRSDPRGYQGLRCAFHGVDPVIDVTIGNWSRPEDFGIGAFLSRNNANIAALRSSANPLPPPKKPATVTTQSKSAPPAPARPQTATATGLQAKTAQAQPNNK